MDFIEDHRREASTLGEDNHWMKCDAITAEAVLPSMKKQGEEGGPADEAGQSGSKEGPLEMPERSVPDNKDARVIVAGDS